MADLFMQKSAVLSPCGLYRYTLTRRWDDAKQDLCFVLLNPSTADASVDDATIRRCLGFAWRHRREGIGGLTVVNLFAFRATKPRELWLAADPVGPENGFHLTNETSARTVVLGWGANPLARSRLAEVGVRLSGNACRVVCLGQNKDGSPKHPLYVPANQPLVPFVPGGPTHA